MGRDVAPDGNSLVYEVSLLISAYVTTQVWAGLIQSVAPLRVITFILKQYFLARRDNYSPRCTHLSPARACKTVL